VIEMYKKNENSVGIVALLCSNGEQHGMQRPGGSL
jgi:hypothetical protein